jgi:hypothetical protein
MPRKASAALALCILAASGYAAFAAWSWPTKTALFPLAIGIPVFCLAALELVWSFTGRSEPKAQIKDVQVSHDMKRAGVAGGWILGFFAAIVLLGFPVAVPLFVFLHLKLDGGESWLTSVVFAGAVWLFFYGLFDRLLHLPFAAGWLIG